MQWLDNAKETADVKQQQTWKRESSTTFKSFPSDPASDRHFIFGAPTTAYQEKVEDVGNWDAKYLVDPTDSHMDVDFKYAITLPKSFTDYFAGSPVLVEFTFSMKLISSPTERLAEGPDATIDLSRIVRNPTTLYYDWYRNPTDASAWWFRTAVYGLLDVTSSVLPAINLYIKLDRYESETTVSILGHSLLTFSATLPLLSIA